MLSQNKMNLIIYEFTTCIEREYCLNRLLWKRFTIVLYYGIKSYRLNIFNISILRNLKNDIEVWESLDYRSFVRFSTIENNVSSVFVQKCEETELDYRFILFNFNFFIWLDMVLKNSVLLNLVEVIKKWNSQWNASFKTKNIFLL